LANQFPFEFFFANPYRFGKEKYPKNNSKPFAEADSPQACLRFRTLPILVGLAKKNTPKIIINRLLKQTHRRPCLRFRTLPILAGLAK